MGLQLENLANNSVRGLENGLHLMYEVGGVSLLDEADLAVCCPGSFHLLMFAEAVEEVVGVGGEVFSDVESSDAQLRLCSSRLGGGVLLGFEDGQFQGVGDKFDDKGSRLGSCGVFGLNSVGISNDIGDCGDGGDEGLVFGGSEDRF